MSLRYSLLIAVLLTLTVPTGADVVFTGRVTDAATGQPIEGVQVTLENTTHGVITDSAGDYSLTVPGRGVSGAEVILTAHFIGYASKAIRFRVIDDTMRVDFALQQTAVELEALVVQGESNPVVRSNQPGVVRAELAAGPQGAGHPHDPRWNTESYDRIYENPYLDVYANPMSTFSIDVDRASYSNVRRFLTSGRLPPPDAVRLEELINYFSYEYPRPNGEHPFSITTEVAPAPWRDGHRLVRVGLQSTPIETEQLPPSNLVFLIDVSGSMRPPNKLPLLKAAFAMLANQLDESDRVAIVVYAGAAGLVLESTPGSERAVILEAIRRLEAGGSTAGGAGIKLAYRIAAENHVSGGNNRVILATDGDFNIGVSSDGEMTRLIEEKREQGTFLTVLGFGEGNLKDSKLEKLADHGNGNYAYIDGLTEARRVLVSEIGATLLTVAKDVKIQIEFNPRRVQAYRLLGYENRMLRAEDFDDDTRDAGELGAGHSVTALYEIIPVGVESEVVVRRPDSLRYQLVSRRSASDSPPELMYLKVRYKTPEGKESRLLDQVVLDTVGRPSDDLMFASAVAAFGMLLRDSEYRGNATIEVVISMAKRSRGDDSNGYRAEFIELAQLLRALTPREADASE